MTGARRKDSGGKKGGKLKCFVNNLHPFCLSSKVTSRAWSKCCSDRKLGYTPKEAASRLNYFLIIPWEDGRDPVSSTFLQHPIRDINTILMVTGLQDWVCKISEDSSIAKLAILYQMSLSSKDYNADCHKLCKEIFDEARNEERKKIEKMINH